jgi:hypothetical protein
MAVHKGSASLRPRSTRSGSSIAAIPVYQSNLYSKIRKNRGLALITVVKNTYLI